MGNPNIISYIARSKRRLEILNILKTNEKSQVEIMKLTKMYKAHTSRTLKELSEKELIHCINPEDRMFKFYKITKKGKEILNDIKRVNK